jgi:hypothetical protein
MAFAHRSNKRITTARASIWLSPELRLMNQTWSAIGREVGELRSTLLGFNVTILALSGFDCFAHDSNILMPVSKVST